MLSLASDWVWDFWVADDGNEFHIFYLHAPRSLADERKRHRNARVGHATSSDLRSWTIHSDVLGPGAQGGFDGTAAWTGCVIRDSDGLWRMFYTGASFAQEWPIFTNIQTVGVATSRDLFTWDRRTEPVVAADARWYETLGTSTWPEEAWRDPWVYRGSDGQWHMLLTARSNQGPDDERGVIGHAVSPDLESWTVTPPVTAPGSGFQHMEVPQLVVAPTGGQSILFSSPTDALSLSAQARGEKGGVWAISAAGESPAQLVAPQKYYSGRIVRDRAGADQLMVVLNLDSAGNFLGEISDPMRVSYDSDGIPFIDETSALPIR